MIALLVAGALVWPLRRRRCEHATAIDLGRVVARHGVMSCELEHRSMRTLR